jgi:hypothetical protein
LTVPHLELNRGLAEHCFRPGQSGNPTGQQGDPITRWTAREFKRYLKELLASPCDEPDEIGHKRTWLEAIARQMLRRAYAGDRGILLELWVRGLGRWRWVIERTFAWLSQFRRLRLRYDKRADVHEAFLSLGCALICWRSLRNRRMPA